MVCEMLGCASPFAGVPVKTLEQSRALVGFVLSDEAVVSRGWRESATAAGLQNDANTNKKSIKGQNAHEPTAEMFLSKKL